MNYEHILSPLNFELGEKRTFVFGDIHSNPKELYSILNFLKESENLSADDNIIFIGDYINKGSDAKKTIDLLLEFKKDFPEVKFLKGNHEDMFMGYLGFENSYGQIFIRNGGEKTLKSYGIKTNLSVKDTLDLMPPGHIDFLKSLTPYIVSEKYIFAHAGLSPITDMNAQKDTDIYWIRDEFIQNIHRFGKTVVFGHTPFNDIWLDLPYKIGIDTGLVYKNKLSCIELKEMAVFQIKLGSAEVVKKLLEQTSQPGR